MKYNIKIIKYLTTFLVLNILVSCAHHKDVRPGVQGVHLVKVQVNSPEQGSRNSVSQAQHFCEKRDKDAAFIKEEKKYVGDMDEKTYNTVKKVRKVAQILGGPVYVASRRRRTKSIGGLVGFGGVAADVVTGRGYTVEMQFKCI